MRIMLFSIFYLLGGCASLQKPIPAAQLSASVHALSFAGWAAINGGGPNARANNNDWHVQNGLRLSVAGGRVALLWRDGASSGYSLELKHRDYPERKLSVLQLDVVEDATGKSITFVWADENARSIGLNLGWLQVGLQVEATRK